MWAPASSPRVRPHRRLEATALAGVLRVCLGVVVVVLACAPTVSPLAASASATFDGVGGGGGLNTARRLGAMDTAALNLTNVTTAPLLIATTTPKAACRVKHCLQCDPALAWQCLECEPPLLREKGQCTANCSKDYFPVRHMTDYPVPDYPRCEHECSLLGVSGIPEGPPGWPAASSSRYNTEYHELVPLQNSSAEQS